MIIRHFLRWIENARVSERMAAAAALARAFLDHQLPFDERCEAEAALTLLLDDPSPKVRAAMAEALSMSRNAPPQIIAALAADQEEVAGVVLVRSPILSDVDLIDLVATSKPQIQVLIASRPRISMGLAAAIAEVGAPLACATLLRNDGAAVTAISLRRMTERHGDDRAVREALLADRRLPAECRHALLVKVGETLREAPFVVALMGRARAERITREACARGSLALIDQQPREELPALVEHLRLRGELTPGFLIRAVAFGKIDFLGAVLVALAGRSDLRVRGLLAGGRDGAVTALFRDAGLPAPLHAVFLCALKVWREVAAGKRVAGAQEVSWLMLRELGAAPGQPGPRECDREAAGLIKAIHLEVLRENARGHALAIAAA